MSNLEKYHMFQDHKCFAAVAKFRKYAEDSECSVSNADMLGLSYIENC